MSKHRETKGNPLHGNNTLITQVRETLSLSRSTVFHGSKCSLCLHFSFCKDHKGSAIANSNYCHHASLGFALGKAAKGIAS